MRQGDTFRRAFTLENLDLDGLDLRCSVREAPNAPAALLYMSTGNSLLTISTSTNTLTFDVPPATTEALPVGNFYYDLELVTPSGDVYTLLEGRWRIVQEITTEDDL